MKGMSKPRYLASDLFGTYECDMFNQRRLGQYLRFVRPATNRLETHSEALDKPGY